VSSTQARKHAAPSTVFHLAAIWSSIEPVAAYPSILLCETLGEGCDQVDQPALLSPCALAVGSVGRCESLKLIELGAAAKCGGVWPAASLEDVGERSNRHKSLLDRVDHAARQARRGRR